MFCKFFSNIRKIMILFFICFLSSFYFSYSVSAALPITLEDWESYNVGVTSGSGTYFDWVRTSGDDFKIISDYVDSPTKSLHTCWDHDGGDDDLDEGWINLTYSFSYIRTISMVFEGIQAAGYAAGGTDYVYQQYNFYNDGESVMQLRLRVDKDSTPHPYNLNLWYRDATGTWNWLDNTIGSTQQFYVNLTHLGGNEMRYECNEKTGDWQSADSSIYDTDDWTTFDQIRITGYTNNPTASLLELELIMDDIIINTTYTGPPGDIPEGYLGVNCYNESSGNNITEFNLLFVNQQGESFYEYEQNNTYIVWGDLLPQGECLLTVSKNDYYPRTYELNIVDGYFVFDGVVYTDVVIDAYLPPINLSHLYYIQVIDEYLNPVEDARVRIKTFCGDTDYQTVSVTFTDGYGYTNAYLSWGKEHIVTISKPGYRTRSESWTPDPSNYGIAYPKVFKITSNATVGPDIDETNMENMVLSAVNSSCMRVVYTNLKNNNSLVSFTIYDYFNSSIVYWYNDSSSPNNVSFVFNHSSVYLVGSILKVVAVPTRLNSETPVTIIRYFNVNAFYGSGSASSSAIGAILSIAFCLFGLTLAHPKKILGPIGIIVMIVGIAITAFVSQTWYIHLLQAIEIFLLVIILLIFKEENIHAV